MKWQTTILLLILCSSVILVSTVNASLHYHANTYVFTFPTYSTAMAFSTDMTFSRAYRISDFWYFNTSTITENWGFQLQMSSGSGGQLLITDFFLSDANQLKFSVSASAGGSTITKVYIPSKGAPSSVHGTASYSYDAVSHVETINVAHPSTTPIAVEVHWGEGGDFTPPTISNVSYNTTITGQPCQFAAKWTDNVGLSGFIYSSNTSGSWANTSWTAFAINPSWANETELLPSAGVIVGFRWYANDSSDNWATSSIYTLTVTELGENIVVLLSTPSDYATTYAKTVILTYIPIFYQTIQNSSLYLFGGPFWFWQRVSWNASAVLNNTVNSFIFTFTQSDTYNWNIAVSNTTTTIYSSHSRTLYVKLEPRYGSLGESGYTAGSSQELYCDWIDGDGLSGFIFRWNGSGSWVSDSWVAFAGSPLEALASVTKTLPSALGVTVGFVFYANDTDNLWNVTGIGSLITSQNTLVPSVVGLDAFWQLLSGGDLLGFLQAIYLTAFTSVDILYGLIIMLVMGAIYIRTRSLILMVILWLLVGSFLIVALPLVASVGVVLIIMGVAGLLYQLFKPHSQSY